MECSDKKCPYHGGLKVRRQRLEGRVVSSTKDQRTVAVEIRRVKRVGKYKRYARTTSKVLAHNPLCVSATPGDVVLLGATRRLSKRKHWVVLKVLRPGGKA